MATAVKTPATSKELLVVLEGIRQKRSELEKKFDADPVNYEITSDIAELREAENRLSERVTEAEKREAAAIRKSQQKKITAAYVAKCKEVAKLQEEVERLVDEVIIQADQLRDAEKEIRLLAQQLDEIPVRPPTPLWQRHGGQPIPYSRRVANALQSL